MCVQYVENLLLRFTWCRCVPFAFAYLCSTSFGIYSANERTSRQASTGFQVTKVKLWIGFAETKTVVNMLKNLTHNNNNITEHRWLLFRYTVQGTPSFTLLVESRWCWIQTFRTIHSLNLIFWSFFLSWSCWSRRFHWFWSKLFVSSSWSWVYLRAIAFLFSDRGQQVISSYAMCCRCIYFVAGMDSDSVLYALNFCHRFVIMRFYVWIDVVQQM